MNQFTPDELRLIIGLADVVFRNGTKIDKGLDGAAMIFQLVAKAQQLLTTPKEKQNGKSEG